MKILRFLLVCLLLVSQHYSCWAEVPVRYDGKMCKMEIITSEEIKNRRASEIVKQKVLEFCKDKYLYNIEIAINNGKCVYIIFYNEKGGQAND